MPHHRLATAFAFLAACTCPDGRSPITYDSYTCDEVARTCTSEQVTVCPCSRPRCPLLPRSECRGITGVAEWVAQRPTENRHVIDGAFTGSEWEGATRLAGLFTDVYMDYRDGRLYFLNDWRSNDEGIRPDCFNYFQIRVAQDWIDLRVYGDGHVEVRRNDTEVDLLALGAYGLGPSPTWPVPHTIYELSLAIEAEQIDVCCFDPLTESTCDVLAREPTVVSLRRSGSGIQVTRQVEADVRRLSAGERCGDGQGVCADSLHCVHRSEGARCASTPDAGPPDGGLPSFDAGPSEDAGPPI